MSRRKRWILLAVGAVFALGWLLWWWFLAWDANTLAQWLAETSAMEHARESHPEYAMELCWADYGIERPGCFEVRLECPDNEDVFYSVYTTQFGRFVDDDFTQMVTNRGATLKRMEAELERNCNLWDLFSDQADHFYWSPELTFLPGYWDEEWRSKLTLNLPLDIQNPPIPLKFSLSLYAEEVSWEALAELLRMVRERMAERDIPVTCYDLELIPMENRGRNVANSYPKDNTGILYIHNFLATDLDSAADLPVALEHYARTYHSELFPDSPSNNAAEQ